MDCLRTGASDTHLTLIYNCSRMALSYMRVSCGSATPVRNPPEVGPKRQAQEIHTAPLQEYFYGLKRAAPQWKIKRIKREKRRPSRGGEGGCKGVRTRVSAAACRRVLMTSSLPWRWRWRSSSLRREPGQLESACYQGAAAAAWSDAFSTERRGMSLLSVQPFTAVLARLRSTSKAAQ